MRGDTRQGDDRDHPIVGLVRVDPRGTVSAHHLGVVREGSECLPGALAQCRVDLEGSDVGITEALSQYGSVVIGAGAISRTRWLSWASSAVNMVTMRLGAKLDDVGLPSMVSPRRAHSRASSLPLIWVTTSASSA
jgi:hypothetical protein